MTHQDVVEDDANREWNNSRPLDVHRWSDYPEVNRFVNAIFDAYFTDEEGNRTIWKKHLKVVLLNLYICWQEDRLYEFMKEAFTLITGKLHIQMKWNDNLTKRQLYAHGAQDRDFYLDMVMHITKPETSNGYQRRMERHKAFYWRS